MIKEDEIKASEHHEKRVAVALVWAGIDGIKKAEVRLEETAGQVFDLVYEKFHRVPSEHDTFKLNGADFPRSHTGQTVKSLIHKHGQDLEFEIVEHVKVTLIWGGTGESKKAEVKITDTAGQVFDLVYDRFDQKASDQDTFELNGEDFPRARFGESVESLSHSHGKELEFEVIPPTSGA